MNKLASIENTLLLGPGPSTVSPNVYRALSPNTIGHLDPRFIDLMDQIKQMLKIVFKTINVCEILVFLKSDVVRQYSFLISTPSEPVTDFVFPASLPRSLKSLKFCLNLTKKS